MKSRYYVGIALLGMAALTMAACDVQPAPAPTVRNQQANKAQEAANSLRFTENSEIDNIKHRLELTADPGKLGFILLMNAAGQPIMYEGVKGKVTSGAKRLTPPDKVEHFTNMNGQSWSVRQGPSDEGTFGTATPYIFYWNLSNTYRQWSGDYLYSDQPIRLKVEPLVINLLPGEVAK